MRDIDSTLAMAASIQTWRASGECLAFVDWARGLPSSRMRSVSGNPAAPADGAWLQARHGWDYSLYQHPGDGTDAPRGANVYWPQGPSGDPAGHIVISDGDGWCWTTDYAGARSVSRQRIARLNQLRGRAFGWTEDHGGNLIPGLHADPDPEPAEPIQEEEPMNITYVQGDKTAHVYAVNHETQRRRYVPFWGLVAASGKAPITMPQDLLDPILKEVGTADHDGRIIGADGL